MRESYRSAISDKLIELIEDGYQIDWECTDGKYIIWEDDE